jgi:hypothetical protein
VPKQEYMNTSVALTLIAQDWTLTPSNTPIPSLTPTRTTTPTITSTSTTTPTITPTFTPTYDPERYYAPSREYSFILPLGWVAVDPDDPTEEPYVLGPQIGDYTLNLKIFREENYFGVSKYVEIVQSQLIAKDNSIKEIQENALISNDGESYFRWEITSVYEETVFHSVIYFFGEDTSILVILYDRRNDSASEMDPLVDKSMQTVIFHPILNGVEGIVL